MLERRYATRRYELLFRTQPKAEEGVFPDFTVNCIVTESRLLEHRQLYGNTASGQLSVVAQANAGQLAIPPGYWSWNSDPTGPDAREVAAWIDDHVVPWFRGIEDAMEAPVEMLLGRTHGVPKDTALEMMLIVYGKEDTGRYLRKLLREDRELADSIQNVQSLNSEIGRVAGLISQFQLLKTAF